MTHKFGCKLPHSVDKALEIDRQRGTDHWQRVLNKEMSKVKITWISHDDITPDDVRSGKAKDMIGFKEIGCHIVFDIKMDFTRKASFCAGAHTNTPMAMAYSSVVSRDSVHFDFMLATLNGLDIMACNLENVYLNASCVEKIWFEGGLKCGSDQGKVCVVVHALYGLKSAGASWCATLAQGALRDIGFVSTVADLEVWILPVAHEDGYEYYKMLLVYVDDVLAISHEPKVLIDAIVEYYKVKPGSDKELISILDQMLRRCKC